MTFLAVKKKTAPRRSVPKRSPKKSAILLKKGVEKDLTTRKRGYEIAPASKKYAETRGCESVSNII